MKEMQKVQQEVLITKSLEDLVDYGNRIGELEIGSFFHGKNSAKLAIRLSSDRIDVIEKGGCIKTNVARAIVRAEALSLMYQVYGWGR